MDDKTPYISFVVTGRNDDYGGDFNTRLQLSVQWLAYLVEKYQLSAELVLVNYNPLPNKPGLEELIAWPVGQRLLEIRMVTIPEEVHLRLIQPTIRKTEPLFEFIAKNAGIRRAKGKFILSTNADILFSENLVAFFAKKKLQSEVLYRSDRYDFIMDTKQWASNGSEFGNLEEYLKKRVFKFFLEGGTFTMRYPPSLDKRLTILGKYNAFRKWYYTNLLKIPGNRFFPLVPRMAAEQLFLLHCHCNASGDMTLMDKNSWYKVRGYIENTWISTHTDSLLVMGARTSGIPVKVMPFPIYHQHHQRRFDFGLYNLHMDQMYDRLLKDSNTMLQTGRPILNQEENWGLSDFNLSEFLITLDHI